MAKAKAQDFYRNYPKPDDMRSGCKVGWYIYKDQKIAKAAAKIAKAEADRMSARGYDFGFQVPGAIRKTKEGMFEVVVP